MATKDEYNSAIQFLCSDASKFLNGHNLIIDGGKVFGNSQIFLNFFLYISKSEIFVLLFS